MNWLPTLLILSSSFLLTTTLVVAQENPIDRRRDEVQKFIAEFWSHELEQSPFLASSYGIRSADGQLPPSDPNSLQRKAAREQQFLKRIGSLDTRGLDDAEKLDIDLLRQELSFRVDDYRLSGHLMPIHQRGGPQIWLPTMSRRMNLDSTEDFRRYLARLEAIPQYLAGIRETLDQGVETGHVPPKVTQQGVTEQFDALLGSEIEDNLFYEPFLEFPESISSEEGTELRERGRTIIRDSVIPAYRSLRDYLANDYIHSCRSSIGALDLPNGHIYYPHLVRHFTTTYRSPSDIHQLGLAEITRIRGEMAKVISKTGFEGDFAEFVQFLRTDSRFYHQSAEALLTGYRDICKRVDALLPQYFGQLPRAPYGVRAIPAHEAPRSTTAYYQPAPPDGTRPGWFYANTHSLHSRPRYEMIALTLHEAVPGHHLQIALANELEGRPDFRKSLHFTAFIEGWALYAESLGTEMGLYSDPYDDFGRLSYEMWRALRLVVDTGIHQFGWTRDQAIELMLENSSLTRQNIESEVDRYIAWPGQALAYKIGEIEIKELRALAEQELQSKFDIRAFHDHLLGAGSIPLDQLNQRMKHWIDQQKN